MKTGYERNFSKIHMYFWRRESWKIAIWSLREWVFTLCPLSFISVLYPPLTHLCFIPSLTYLRLIPSLTHLRFILSLTHLCLIPLSLISIFVSVSSLFPWSSEYWGQFWNRYWTNTLGWTTKELVFGVVVQLSWLVVWCLFMGAVLILCYFTASIFH